MTSKSRSKLRVLCVMVLAFVFSMGCDNILGQKKKGKRDKDEPKKEITCQEGEVLNEEKTACILEPSFVCEGDYSFPDDDLISETGESCTLISGDLNVIDTDLDSLDGLKNIQEIVGSLIIKGNKNLSNLQGLVALESLGGLEISDNEKLESISILKNVAISGDVSIEASGVKKDGANCPIENVAQGVKEFCEEEDEPLVSACKVYEKENDEGVCEKNNLIVNGSFESYVFDETAINFKGYQGFETTAGTGWDISWDCDEASKAKMTIVDPVVTNQINIKLMQDVFAAEGAKMASLHAKCPNQDGVTTNLTISQEIKTISGHKYLLGFSAKRRDLLTHDSLTVNVVGTVTSDVVHYQQFDGRSWLLKKEEFTATGDTYKFIFTAKGRMYLDNIELYECGDKDSQCPDINSDTED